jgi:hypothetical protein
VNNGGLQQDVATREARKASRARAPDSPMPGEGRSPNGPANGEQQMDPGVSAEAAEGEEPDETASEMPGAA